MKKIYLLIYYLFLNKFPTQPVPGWRTGYKLRAMICKRIFKKSGKNIVIKKNAYFGTGEYLEIGNNSQLGENCKVENDIILGNDVVMGPDIVIFSSAHEFVDPLVPINKQGSKERRPVVIGDDVWLGTRVIVMPGVKIGSHSVVGANSVVTKDLEEYGIYAGVPAKKIGSRLDVNEKY